MVDENKHHNSHIMCDQRIADRKKKKKGRGISVAENKRNEEIPRKWKHQTGPLRASHMLNTHLGELVPSTPTSSGDLGTRRHAHCHKCFLAIA